jgi:hypothetical protein
LVKITVCSNFFVHLIGAIANLLLVGIAKGKVLGDGALSAAGEHF